MKAALAVALLLATTVARAAISYNGDFNLPDANVTQADTLSDMFVFDRSTSSTSRHHHLGQLSHLPTVCQLVARAELSNSHGNFQREWRHASSPAAPSSIFSRRLLGDRRRTRLPRNAAARDGRSHPGAGRLLARAPEQRGDQSARAMDLVSGADIWRRHGPRAILTPCLRTRSSITAPSPPARSSATLSSKARTSASV